MRIFVLGLSYIVVCLYSSIAMSFVSIQVFDPQDGTYLGEISDMNDLLPFKESLLLKVTPNSPTDKIRLEPLNTDCGSDQVIDQEGPFEFLLQPLSPLSHCEIQLVGWRAPWDWVGSYLFSVSFDATDGVADLRSEPSDVFSALTLYDLDTGDYLGVVEDGVARVPYTEVIGVSVSNHHSMDWVRLIPKNDRCGKRRRFDIKPPFQLKVFPESQEKHCEFTVQGYQKPRTLVAEMELRIIFISELIVSELDQTDSENTLINL